MAAAIEAESLPLYYLDQNQGCATPYEVTTTQAEAMKQAGRGKFINRKKAFQLCELAPVRHNYLCSLSSDSTASISPNEMEANVGITSGAVGDPAVRHIVVRAQQKIRAIGRRERDTFDSRAPLAFGGLSWPVQSNRSEARA